MTTRSAPPAALAEPTTSPPLRWVVWISLASVGIWSGFFGPIQVLLAQQAAVVAPDAKETALSLVTGVGALVSVLLNPMFGAFSDRTALRVGRRVPWVAGGLLGGVVAMLLLSVAQTVTAMVVAWALAQAALNAMLAAVSATVPDQVPRRERGAVGGWLALAQTVGVVVGTGLAAGTGSIAAGYLATAALLAVTSLPYLLDSRDLRLDPALRPAFDARRFVRSFWVSPRAHPDFGWAWLTRFLVNLGNALVVLYMLYYLQDAVRLTDRQAETGVFWLTLLYGVCTVVTAVGAGIWSDRVRRRKVFVIASGLLIAVSLVVLALVPTWPGAITGATLLGLGFGAYTAVDFALITEVLPSADDRAKDLGVINIAAALPQVLAPVIAGVLLGLGGSYGSLYLAAAVITLAGALGVQRIRSVA